jgi:hypothetical protein
LIIEKTVITAKNKELAEKRNQEEMKEFINEFGMARAKFKEEVERKIELKRMVRQFEEFCKENAEFTTENNDNVVERENKGPTVFLDDEFQNNNEKIEEIKAINIENDKPIVKVNNGNIKNLNGTSDQTQHDQEIRINIKLKVGNVPNKHEILNEVKVKVEKMPSDLVINSRAIDEVFDNRHKYQELLNVKEIDNPKDGYKYHYNPLSAYDNTNVQVISVSPILKKEERNRPRTGFEFIRNNYDKEGDNFLKLRKTMGPFKVNDINSLKDCLNKNNTNIPFSTLQSAFLSPNENTVYPRFFLPAPGYGVYDRPVDPNAKKPRARSNARRKPN